MHIFKGHRANPMAYLLPHIFHNIGFDKYNLKAKKTSATQLEQSILTKKDQNCAQSKLQIN